MIFLDTHVLVWLGINQEKRLSPKARRTIENNPVSVSPFVNLELGYLFEIGRIKKPPGEFLPALLRQLEATIHEHSMLEVVSQAERLSWTRDPLDRLIVGHALAASGKLVTKDEHILKYCKSAVW